MQVAQYGQAGIREVHGPTVIPGELGPHLRMTFREGMRAQEEPPFQPAKEARPGGQRSAGQAMQGFGNTGFNGQPRTGGAGSRADTPRVMRIGGVQ